jgi:hypothetical protein
VEKISLIEELVDDVVEDRDRTGAGRIRAMG